MKKLLLMLLLIPGCTPGPLWKADFEGDVQVLAPYAEHGQWWRKIGGKDWVDPPHGKLEPRFQPLVRPEDDPLLYTVETVIPGVGRNNSSALFLMVRLEDEWEDHLVLSTYFWEPTDAYQRGYMSYWIYFQPDLHAALKPQGYPWNFRQVWEVKYANTPEGVTSFRINVALEWNDTRGAHWTCNGQYAPIKGVGDYEFRVKNFEAPVPAGEWFKMETYLDQDPVNGRFICRISKEENGSWKNWILCDHRGPTMVEGYKALKWAGMKVYTDRARSDRPHWQYIDDIEIWGDVDELPRSKP